jgi:carbon monoxide dehydrogenase subunit G
MAIIEMTMEIKAPVPRVFSFVNDAQRVHEWASGFVSLEVTPGKGGRTGEVWTMVYAMGPMRSRMKATVFESEENKRIVWEISGGMMEGKEVQTYEPMGANAARYIHHFEFRPKGLMKVLGPLMLPMMKRGFRRDADKMKRICEAEAGKSAQGS